jgi:mevalonate pyrophosphate decarboxylase
MKHEGFPWTDVGPGPEPRLPSDFASRVIEQARMAQARKRRARIGIGLSAGFAALIATLLWMRSTPSDQQTLAQAARPAASSSNITDASNDTWNDLPGTDLATVLMPGARQAEKFDAYYGAAAWDSYASWDPEAYDASRTQ